MKKTCNVLYLGFGDSYRVVYIGHSEMGRFYCMYDSLQYCFFPNENKRVKSHSTLMNTLSSDKNSTLDSVGKK